MIWITSLPTVGLTILPCNWFMETVKDGFTEINENLESIMEGDEAVINEIILEKVDNQLYDYVEEAVRNVMSEREVDPYLDLQRRGFLNAEEN